MLWIWTILACDSGCHVIFIFYLSLFILALCSLHLKVCTRWACQKFLSFLIVLSCCYVLTVAEELSILIGIFCWLIISFNIWFSFLHFAFVRQFTDISLVEIALKRILLVCLLIITCFQLFISAKLDVQQLCGCLILFSVLQKTFKVGINIYSRSDVVAMEWLVQEVLNFKCFVTTTNHFLWFYLKAAKADDRVADLANYLSLLSLLNHKQLSFWPSTVAAAVVALACLATDKESSCHLVMEVNTRILHFNGPHCAFNPALAEPPQRRRSTSPTTSCAGAQRFLLLRV